MPPQGLGVPPDLDLLNAQVRQTAEPQHAEAGQGPDKRGPELARRATADEGARDCAEDEREGESWEIAVSVIGQLVSRMDDPDHRSQRNRIIRPGREPSGPTLPQRDHRHGDDRHAEGGKEELSVEQVYMERKLIE